MNETSEPKHAYDHSSSSFRVPVIRILLILAAWSFCIYHVWHSYVVREFFDFEPFLFGLLAGGISFLSFCIDSYRYKLSKHVFSFLSTAISAFCILALFIIRHSMENRYRTPVILYAVEDRKGDNKIKLALRKNGTYKCEKGGFFATQYNQWGKYRIEDSIIYLDDSEIFDVIVTDRLLMKSMPAPVPKKQSLIGRLFNPSVPDTLPGIFLLQVTHQGDTIPGVPSLRVY